MADGDRRPVFFYIMRCIATSAGKTKMEYEVYRHKTASDGDFKDICDSFQQILKEDKELCNAAQENLNGGIFQSGELHPRVEKGPLYFQSLTKKLVMHHRNEEETLGREIWRVTPRHKTTDQTRKEIDFCNSLEAGTCAAENQTLEW